MVGDVGVHAREHAELVGVTGLVLDQVGNPESALAPLLPAPLGGDQLSLAVAAVGSVSFGEFGLVLERFHVSRTAPHVQEDHPLGSGGVVRLFGRQRGRVVGPSLLAQAGQGQRTDTTGGQAQQGTARECRVGGLWQSDGGICHRFILRGNVPGTQPATRLGQSRYRNSAPASNTWQNRLQACCRGVVFLLVLFSGWPSVRAVLVM